MRNILIVVIFLMTVLLYGQTNLLPEFSKAGFWEVKDSGREVFNFNIGWRFYKGAAENAYQTDFDDSQWDVVNVPHGLEYNSSEVSGSSNYQGQAWYRKTFTTDKLKENTITKLHFEAVMGKCKIWLNGVQIGEHFGGYLPFTVQLDSGLLKKGKNIITVWADNSDDASFPPGKAQTRLDFAYFGGIYRDVWMTSTHKIYISNPNEVSKIAGGGIFTHTNKVSDTEATITAKVAIVNEYDLTKKVNVKLLLKDPEGKLVAEKVQSVSIPKLKSVDINTIFNVNNPKLWSPITPSLYRLEVIIINEKGLNEDGVAIRLGIRTIEFKGKEGFFLNNKPYSGKLIGVNRHQDHGYVGNAMSNNAQWRDAKLIKEAGCDIVRAAHYPSDPAFMDACDALGLFYIEATPGWQFWNDDNPVFEKRVYEDIRNMVRRDRNYAAIIMWEPILNETHYPSYFAKKAHTIVHEEYPFSGAYTVCDNKADGQEFYDVVYAHDYNVDFLTEKRCTFTREFGDNVDDFNAQNSTSRVARGWGEQAQLIQAQFYADVPYEHTTLESLNTMPPQHVGGTLWAGFDHQRGYHCDPFYGGLTDVFRQTKYSFQMFKSQRNISDINKPFVFIAHEMTPFSNKDVTVYTNCESVRLTLHNGMEIFQKQAAKYETEFHFVKKGEPKKKIQHPYKKMSHPIVTFENVYDFMDTKNMHRMGEKKNSSILVEGIIGGKVVVSERKTASKRPDKLKLTLEDREVPLVANGSDFVLVTASIVDSDGIIKRLTENTVKFEVTGQGAIIGDESIEANPKRLNWGTAPILVRSTTIPGKIKIKASLFHGGINSPLEGELIIESKKAQDDFVFNEVGTEKNKITKSTISETNEEQLSIKLQLVQKELNDLKLKEEQRNQENFDKKR